MGEHMTHRARTAIAAGGAGLLLAAGIPATAQAVDNYPPGSQAVTCIATRNASSSQIKVNVNPNQPGKRYYTFHIEKLRKGTWVSYTKSKRTKGKKETRTVNVSKGTYRVQCHAKFGFIGATSATVLIKK